MVRREAGGEEVLEELVGRRRSEEEEGLWRNLRLDWVRNWDQSSQTSVLLSRLQHTGRALRFVKVWISRSFKKAYNSLSVCVLVHQSWVPVTWRCCGVT